MALKGELLQKIFEKMKNKSPGMVLADSFQPKMSHRELSVPDDS